MGYDDGGGVTQFKMKRSAAWSARQDFNLLQELNPLPIMSCFDLLQRFFVDSDVIQSWALALNKLIEKGEDYLSDQQRRDFISDATIQFAKKATFELDPVSRLLIMGSGSRPEGMSWFMRFPDCLVSNFKAPGTFGVIDGLPRTGKTSLGCSFAKLLGEIFHFRIITNIVIKNPPDYYIIVGTLGQMVKEMVRPGKFVAILDETATYIPKKRALAKELMDFEALARFIGKWKGGLIVITHSFERDVPSLLQEWTTEKYKKIELSMVRCDLEKHNGFVTLHKTIKDVPDTDFDFVTEDTVALKFDINISQMLNDIQDIEYNKKPDEIVRWIDDSIAYNKRKTGRTGGQFIDKEKAIARIDELKELGFSGAHGIAKTAKELGCSPNTLTKYYYHNYDDD